MEIELTAGETVRAISAIVSVHEEGHANTPRGRATDNDMLNVRIGCECDVHKPNPPATLNDSSVPLICIVMSGYSFGSYRDIA